MFLTHEEMIQLTGHHFHAYQRRWLDKRGWKYERAVNGRPVVLRSYAEGKLSDGQPEAKQEGPRMRLDAIKKAA